jgi:hypothetical protein
MVSAIAPQSVGGSWSGSSVLGSAMERRMSSHRRGWSVAIHAQS